MAFGISRKELQLWKETAKSGDIALLTHYWLDERFPHCTTVTKAACSNLDVLVKWGEQYGLKKEWIHQRSYYPHFDLLGEKQVMILEEEGEFEQIARFHLKRYV